MVTPPVWVRLWQGIEARGDCDLRPNMCSNRKVASCHWGESSTKSRLRVVGPGDIFRQVPERKRNEELRSREYLTPAEIDKLIKAAKEGRWGATLILVAYRHGLRAKEAAELECGPGKAREAIGEASPKGAVSMNDGFVVFRRPIVAQDIPIGGVDIGDDLDILRQEQKLFPHFGGRS